MYKSSYTIQGKTMKKKYSGIISILILTGSLFAISIQGKAEEQTEDVVNLMSTVERKIKTLEKEKNGSSVNNEIETIKGYLNEAKDDLKKGDAELAYYKISLGMSYLKKIDAQKELLNAEKNSNNEKNNIQKKEDDE